MTNLSSAQTQFQPGHYVQKSNANYRFMHLQLNKDFTYKYEASSHIHYEYLEGNFELNIDTIKLIFDSNQTMDKHILIDSLTQDTSIINFGDPWEHLRISKLLIRKKKLITLDPVTNERAVAYKKVYYQNKYKRAENTYKSVLRKKGKHIDQFTLYPSPFVKIR